MSAIEVKNDAGSIVYVERADTDTIRVTWLCGVERDFTPVRLRQALASFDKIAPFEGGYKDIDSSERPYNVRVIEETFYASDSRIPVDTHDHQGKIPWPEFRQALESALAETPSSS